MEEPKKQRIILAVVKPSKYGWIGKLGMADIAISHGKKHPEDLIISLIERPQYENRGSAPQQGQYQQAPKPQPKYAPQGRPEAPPLYEEGDPGPGNDNLPF